jgi:hypothetical protein
MDNEAETLVSLLLKAIERIVASKGEYLPKIHKDTVLSMSISDEDTDAGSDFIKLQPISALTPLPLSFCFLHIQK